MADVLLLGGAHQGRIMSIDDKDDVCVASDQDGARYCVSPAFVLEGKRVAFPEDFSAAAKAAALHAWQQERRNANPRPRNS